MKAYLLHRLSGLLHATGKRFGIDAAYYAKNSAIVMASHAVTLLYGVIVGYTTTRLFTPDVYGQYRFVLSVVGVVGMMKLSGLSSSIAVHIAKKDTDSLRYTARLHTLISFVGVLALLGFIAVLPLWNRLELWPLFVIAALLFIPDTFGITWFGGLIKGEKKFAHSLRVNVYVRFLIIAAAVWSFVFYRSIALLLFINIGIPALIYSYYARKMLLKYKPEGRSAETLKYGAHLTLATLPVTIAWQIDQLMITALFGMTQLATFSVAILIPEQFKVLCKELLVVPFAKQAEGADSMARRLHLAKIVAVLTVVTAAGIGLYIAVAPWIMPILFPQYDNSVLVPLTQVTSLLLIVIPSNLILQYLEAHKQLKVLRYSYWVASAGLVGGLLLLVPMYGLMGAIAARAVFRAIVTTGCWIGLFRAPLAADTTGQTDGIRT